jgi:hypothetical protein
MSMLGALDDLLLLFVGCLADPLNEFLEALK